jgi:hypothetical protein
MLGSRARVNVTGEGLAQAVRRAGSSGGNRRGHLLVLGHRGGPRRADLAARPASTDVLIARWVPVNVGGRASALLRNASSTCLRGHQLSARRTLQTRLLMGTPVLLVHGRGL